MNNLAVAAELPTGAYAERIERPPGSLDRFAAAVVAPLLRRRAGAWTRWVGFPAMVDAASGDLARLSDAALLDRGVAV
jgi:hypothetical protein